MPSPIDDLSNAASEFGAVIAAASVLIDKLVAAASASPKGDTALLHLSKVVSIAQNASAALANMTETVTKLRQETHALQVFVSDAAATIPQ